MRLARWLMLLTLAACVAVVGLATTFYVDGTYGNNSNDGLSTSTAKRNISTALAISTTGHVIQVASSIYQETNWLPSGQEMRLSSTGPVIVYQTDPRQTDSIGDGISDGWRQYYFGNGATTNGSSCASCDPDGDGRTNLQEFYAGSDPNDPASPASRNLFFYDNLGRLAVVIATNGTDAAFYDYDAVGNITAIRRQSVGAVNLFVVSPGTASGNTTITLQGTGFSPIIANNTVLFGSLTAQVVSASATQLKVLAPTNAVTCLISVTTGGNSATNANPFTTGIGVAVSPGLATVTAFSSFTQQFTATVYGTNNQNVTWNINGWVLAGTNTAWGSITTNGLYTAPANSVLAGFLTIHARSVADPDPIVDGIATIIIPIAEGPVYSPAVSVQLGVPSVLGPIYSATVSASP